MNASLILIHLLMLSPVLLEGVFDKLMWKWKGPGSDKPISTWVVRPILWVGSWFAVYYIDADIGWFPPAFLIIAYFGLFFPLFINLLLGVKWYHVAETDNKWSFDYWVNKIPGKWMYLWARIWLVFTALCVYYQDQLVYGIRSGASYFK